MLTLTYLIPPTGALKPVSSILKQMFRDTPIQHMQRVTTDLHVCVA